MWAIKQQFLRLLLPLDGWLLLAMGLLCGLGLLALYSASGQSMDMMITQATYIVLACGLMLALSHIPPGFMKRLAPMLYLLGLFLLIGVALFGEISHGARRWLSLGITRIQPSEIMKLAVPMVLAWYFDWREQEVGWKDFLVAAVMVALPVLLILKQPDLGTATLVAAAGFFVLFFAGLPWKVILGGAVAFLASLPVVWSLMHDYQRERVLTLIDPGHDPLGKGWHTLQGTIAIGSGGPLGKGWLHGTQTHLDFIPEPTTDFIFAVWSEEFGLIGNLLMLCVFLLLFSRGLVIARQASSTYGRLLASALTLTVFTYSFVNMGMVSGILPVVGVPLPFISKGGTALMTLAVAFGMLMAVHNHRKLMKR